MGFNARIVLDGTTITIPSNPSSVPTAPELAGHHLGRITQRLAALPHPLRPLVVVMAFPRCAQFHVLVVGAPPIERLETRLCSQEPCLGLRMPERVDLG